MNQDQIISLIQSFLKIGGSLLVARGTVSGQQWQEILGGALALLGLWASHKSNAAPSASPQLPFPTVVKSLLFALCASSFAVGCASIDPPLPGTTAPAPLLAFTNGSAYFLGHPASSNEIYTVAKDATTIGVAALLREEPDATNYLSDAQAVFQSVTTGGIFSQSQLVTGLNLINLKNSDDRAAVNALASSVLSLAGLYVNPLISSDTNSAPFVKAALGGIAAGL